MIEIISKYISFIKKTSTNELIFRCPICGDSKKEYNGHLYVEEESLNYICFKCGIKGKSIIQLLINLINENSIECDINDKRYLNKYLIKIVSDNLVKSNIEKEKFEIMEEVIIEEHIEEEMIEYLTKKRSMEEQFVIDSMYIPYLQKRFKGIEFFLKELIETNRLYLYYSKEIRYNKNYKPSTLLNRLYFNLGNGIFMSREIDKELEKDTKFKKYVFYTPKNSKVKIPPFILNNNKEINTLYLVEGVFDCIKLFCFIKDDVDNVGVMSLNGKFVTNHIMSIINTYNNLLNVMYFPDSDVKDNEIEDTINHFKRNIFNKNINLLIGKIDDSRYKDIGEFERKEHLKKIIITTSNQYQTKNVVSQLEKIKNFFVGV